MCRYFLVEPTLSWSRSRVSSPKSLLPTNTQSVCSHYCEMAQEPLLNFHFCKTINFRSWEDAQWSACQANMKTWVWISKALVRRLAQRHTSVQSPRDKAGTAAHICNLSAGEAETGVCLELVHQQGEPNRCVLGLVSTSVLKNKMEKQLKKTSDFSLRHLPVHIHMHVNVHYTYMCIR